MLTAGLELSAGSCETNGVVQRTTWMSNVAERPLLSSRFHQQKLPSTWQIPFQNFFLFPFQMKVVKPLQNRSGGPFAGLDMMQCRLDDG